MPARLAIQASRVHNAWLCLIWIVLFFRPRAKKAMRSGNATTIAASPPPDPPPVVNSSTTPPCGFITSLGGFLLLRVAPGGGPGGLFTPFGTLEIPGGRLRRPLHEAGRSAPPKSANNKSVTIGQMSQNKIVKNVSSQNLY